MTTQIKQFEKQQNLPIYWFNKSSDLRASAAALWISREEKQSNFIVGECGLGQGFIMAAAVGPVFWMLCGMSLELLYKAIIVAKGGKAEPSHDLVKLVKAAGIRINKDTEHILKILTESIIWYGRYPVPKSHEPMEKLLDHIEEYFFEPAQPGKFKRRKSNKFIRWDSFNRLWLEGNLVYRKYSTHQIASHEGK